MATTTIDETGQYVFEDLPVDEYSFELVVPENWRGWFPPLQRIPSFQPEGGDSQAPDVDRIGYRIAFVSEARISFKDTNDHADVYLYDLRNGGYELASISDSGEVGDDASGGFFSPHVSIDDRGSLIAFSSDAENLVPDDNNADEDVFVYDADNHTIERISIAGDGSEANSYSERPVLSGNGRYVGYLSTATNLVANDSDDFYDVYVYNRLTGETELVSVATGGGSGNADSSYDQRMALSYDGRFVAFASEASNLVPDDTNFVEDVFVYDRVDGTMERVSVASDGTEGDDYSGEFESRVSISDDGRFVAFDSFAENLVPDDTNFDTDVFVHDRLTGITERVSVSGSGAEGNGWSAFPSLSGDGRYVTFVSAASNLIADDANGREDLFIYDRRNGAIERVITAPDGSSGNGFSYNANLSGNGRFVVFDSDALI